MWMLPLTLEFLLAFATNRQDDRAHGDCDHTDHRGHEKDEATREAIALVQADR